MRVARAAPLPGGTNIEKPVRMPLPVSRGGRKALLQRKSAALGAAFAFLPPPCGEGSGVGVREHGACVTPHPDPPRKGGGRRKSNQLAAAAGTSRWRFMTIL